MSAQMLSSKVIFREEEPRVRISSNTSGTVIGVVGLTERGPIGKAVLCTPEEFRRRFGGFTRDSVLPLALDGLWANSNSPVWVVRTAHYDDVSDPTTLTARRASGDFQAGNIPGPAVIQSQKPGPFNLAPGDRLVLETDNSEEQEITFFAAPATISNSGSSGPYALSGGEALTVVFEQGEEQTIVFRSEDFADITQATGPEVAAAINAQLVGGRAMFDEASGVTIQSDIQGTASKIQVTGDPANGALGFDTAEHSGNGNVANLNAVTVSEVVELVISEMTDVNALETADGMLQLQSWTIGDDGRIQVRPATASGLSLDNDVHTGADSISSTVLRAEGKDPGTYGNRLAVEIVPASSGDAGFFDLHVIDDGIYREAFYNLCLAPNHERNAETVINKDKTGSIYARVTVLKEEEGLVPDSQYIDLSGGDDGLFGLSDGDFLGSEISKTGLRALDVVQDLSLICIPDRPTPAVHYMTVDYCENIRGGMVFPVLDSPRGLSSTEIVDYVDMSWLRNLSEYGAIYWPWVKVLNPAKSVLGQTDTVTIPPSALVCGVMARNDGARPGGIYQAPAGVENGILRGVQGLETQEVLEEVKRDLVYPKQINPITTEPGRPIYIDGAKTLKPDGNFPYVAERRGVNYIKRSLKNLVQFARHKNNTEELRSQVARTIKSFLMTQMNVGAFRYNDPNQAFFIDVSENINTPITIFEGKLLARVFLATNKSVDYVIVSIGQDTRLLEEQLAASS